MARADSKAPAAATPCTVAHWAWRGPVRGRDGHAARSARRIAALGALLAALLAAAPLAGRAEPLAKETCDLLAAEHAQLVAAGVKEWMAGGAAAARAKLSPAQLDQIRRWIDVDEQLAFRCGLFRTRSALPRDIEDAPPEAEKKKEPEAPKAKPRPRPKAQPAAADPSATPDGSEAKPKPAARKKPAKADDAYVAPGTKGGASQ